MKKSTPSTLMLTALTMVAAVGGCAPQTSNPSADVALSSVALSPTQQLDKDIAFHKDRVKNDPQGAIGFAMLSEAYLAKAQAIDDDAAGVEAEKAAKQSLKIRQVGNSRAARRLTESLLQQHRFVDAEDAARLTLKLGSGDLQSVRLLGDVLLELGKYEEFKRLASKNFNLSQTPEGAATMARWYEVIGKPDLSIALLKGAVEKVENAGPAQQKAAAWYKTQLGWTALRAGNTDLADASFHDAINFNSAERKAYAGMAKLALDQGDWSQAVDFCRKANEIAPLTNVLGWEATALRELGKDYELKVVIAKIDNLNSSPAKEAKEHSHGSHHHHHDSTHSRHTHNRLYASFLADYGRSLRAAHHMAEEDLQWRKDIYAYDTFAWATYRFWKLDPQAKKEEGDGLLKEAVAAIKKATATGTLDPTILAHANEILTSR